MKIKNNGIRFDLQVIASWIEPNAKVISLGCGEGDLLYYLKQEKQISGTGIDHNEEKVAKAIQRGLSVLQGDISREILDYPDNMFDYVVLSQTLQQIYEPSQLIKSMLRIGRMGIVSFPNFSHWKSRMQLLFTGYAPVTKQLPFQWHDTPNIRVITLKDFRKYAKALGFRILKEATINTDNQDKIGKYVTFFPNLRATYGIFLIGKKTT